jgi:hypothetical protein
MSTSMSMGHSRIQQEMCCSTLVSKYASNTILFAEELRSVVYARA